MPSSPVTLRQIAAKAGLSAAAVSLALRNSPQIRREVRERVSKLATKMGYRPNPLLAAYQAQVRALKLPKYQATLAWTSDFEDSHIWQRPWNAPLFNGARARAHALGYVLEEIRMPVVKIEDWEGNVRRFQKILLSRGIYGVILPNLNRAHHAALPWDEFAVVCIGRTHLTLEKSTYQVPNPFWHHSVNEDSYGNTRLAVRKLRESGCRRVGLALSQYADLVSDGLCSAAYLRQASDWPTKERIHILYSADISEVATWVRKHHVDAVVCNHPDVRIGVQNAGLHVPKDVRIAHLHLAPDVAGWSGIDHRLDQIGSAAVDILTAHLVRNERGVPPFSKELLIEGFWVDGAT